MRINSSSLLLLASFCLMITASTSAVGRDHGASATLAPAKTLSGRRAAPAPSPKLPFDTKSVLVRFKAGTALGLKAQARASIQGRLLRAYALVPGLEHVSIGSRGLDVQSAIRILNRLPFVEYAQPNYVILANAIPNDEYFPEQWALHNTGQDSMFGVWLGGTPDADIDAPEAWDTETSSGTVVALIDTGIAWDHPDLDGNVWINPGEIPSNNLDDDGNGYVDDVRGWDFVNGDNDPFDGHGHGSHVAGVVGAEGNNGLGVSGVLWQGKLMALKVLADDGTGFLAHVVAAIEYAVAKNVKVSNNSYGYTDYTGEEAGHQALYDAIAAARAQNHLFVAAAGNDGADNDTLSNPHYPSSLDLDNIIAVAATDNTDARASFSNYGPTTVDIGAPGVDVFSTWTITCFIFVCDYDYAWLSGTSMATPHVAAVTALVYGRHPDWSYSQVRDRVFNSARPISALQGITVTGGVVNAAEALVEPGSAAPPVAPLDLQAVAVSHDRIDLAWTDSSGDEDGFEIERSLDGGNWTLVATVGANVTRHADMGLATETTYYYRVRAYNAGGPSAYTNTASAATPAGPAFVDITAHDETAVAGTVSGSYLDTHADDGVVQSITETISGGKPSRRYSFLDHRWTFDVGAGGALTLFADAWTDPVSTEDFKFQYAIDGESYVDLCTVGNDCAAGKALMPGLAGTITVRVLDTDRSPGSQSLDTVHIDHLLIRSEGGGAGASPITLTATGYKAKGVQQVDLQWSGATSVNVDVWRDGRVVATTSNDGAYTDNIGKKGGGSHTYNVCEAGSMTVCSAAKTVTF